MQTLDQYFASKSSSRGTWTPEGRGGDASSIQIDWALADAADTGEHGIDGRRIQLAVAHPDPDSVSLLRGPARDRLVAERLPWELWSSQYNKDFVAFRWLGRGRPTNEQRHRLLQELLGCDWPTVVRWPEGRAVAILEQLRDESTVGRAG